MGGRAAWRRASAASAGSLMISLIRLLANYRAAAAAAAAECDWGDGRGSEPACLPAQWRGGGEEEKRDTAVERETD